MVNDESGLTEFYTACLKVALKVSLKYPDVVNIFTKVIEATFMDADSPKDKVHEQETPSPPNP